MDEPGPGSTGEHARQPASTNREIIADITDMLTVVLGDLEQLRQLTPDEQRAKLLQRAEQAGQRMAHLLERLTDRGAGEA